MSARPKLPAATREQIQCIERRRRTLAKLIAELQDEKRALPKKREIAAKAGVNEKTLRRIYGGEPYKNRHPEDEHARAA